MKSENDQLILFKLIANNGVMKGVMLMKLMIMESVMKNNVTSIGNIMS